MANIFTTWYLRINHPLFDFHNIYLFRLRIYPALSLSPSLSLLSQASWSFIASLLCMLQSLYRANKSCSFWIVCFVCCHCCSYCSHISLSLSPSVLFCSKPSPWHRYTCIPSTFIFGSISAVRCLSATFLEKVLHACTYSKQWRVAIYASWEMRPASAHWIWTIKYIYGPDMFNKIQIKKTNADLYLYTIQSLLRVCEGEYSEQPLKRFY